MYEQLNHKIYYRSWGDSNLSTKYLKSLNNSNIPPRGLFYLSHSGGANWLLNVLDGNNVRQVFKNGDPGTITYRNNMFVITPKYTYMAIFYIGDIPVEFATTAS